MDSIKKIVISVCYMTESNQELMHVEVPIGSTLMQAVEASGILQKYKEIDLTKNAVGIYGKTVNCDYVLDHHDRVEIYRPLTVDPMQARRQRANSPN